MSGFKEILTDAFIYIVAAFIVIKILLFFWNIFKRLVFSPFSSASSLLSSKKKDKTTSNKKNNAKKKDNNTSDEEEYQEDEDDEDEGILNDNKKNGKSKYSFVDRLKKRSDRGRNIKGGKQWDSRNIHNEAPLHIEEARDLKIPRSKTICYVTFLNGKDYVVDGGERSSLLPITIPFLEKRNPLVWVAPSSKPNSLLDVVITDVIDIRPVKMGCSLTRRDLNTKEPLFVANIHMSLHITDPFIMFSENSGDIGVFIKDKCDRLVKNLLDTVEGWVLNKNDEDNHITTSSSSHTKMNGLSSSSKTSENSKSLFIKSNNSKSDEDSKINGWSLNIDDITYKVCLTQADRDKAWHEREMKKVKELSKTYQEYLIMLTEVAVEVINTLKEKHPETLSDVPLQDILPICLNQFNTVNYTNIPVKNL